MTDSASSFVSIESSSTVGEHDSFSEVKKPVFDELREAWDVYANSVLPSEFIFLHRESQTL